MHITEHVFGKMNEIEIKAITLKNKTGAAITATNYGATLLEWLAPDREGNFVNITLGLDNLDDYVSYRPYYGATIGRVAGRITGGTFTLNNTQYQLEQNQNGNHLHGGLQGLDTKIWDYRVENGEDEASIIFSLTDPEGSNAYPGTLQVEVTYTFTEDNEWKVSYQATSDAPTLFNPTNHVYFNLNGEWDTNILNHELFINADSFVELNANTIPTGHKLPVAGTPFDFREPTLAKQATESNHPQTKQVGGLDHPFVLNKADQAVHASLYEETSGRCIEMVTSEPVVVVFMHNGPSEFDYKGKKIPAYAGITLETQNYPDAINQEGFGNIVLNPGETYRSETVYKFSIK